MTGNSEEQYVELTFDQWIKVAFDNPTNINFEDVVDADISLEYPITTITYLTKLFENSDTVLLPYSKAQVYRSFGYLCNPIEGHTRVIFDEMIPLAERLRFVESIYCLFERYFVQNCSWDTVDPSTNSLDATCHAWWDNFPTEGLPDNPAYTEIDTLLLDVMRRTLLLDSVPCQESALLGLDLWHKHYPEKTAVILDNFFARKKEFFSKVEPTFEEWVVACFDHLPDFYGVSGSAPALSSELTVVYYTSLFENSDTVLAPYSEDQINQSLWGMLFDGDLGVLVHPTIPLPERLRCAESIYSLFAKCFAVRCTPHQSHQDEPGAGKLNSICYMWWDICPLFGAPDEPSRKEMDAKLLEVMQRTLELDSIACQESALHGLGHWHLAYPKQVESIIRKADIPPELKSYAQSAQAGLVQ